MNRMLKPELIPPCLWSVSSQLLHLPAVLTQAFESAVDARGIRGLLTATDDEGPIGGRSEDETFRHFVNRFDGSSARLQLAFLDPHDHLDETSNVILSRLSGGVTCFVDAPCGAGAGFLSLLLTIAKLRELDIVSRLRLDVRLIAADVSDSAREIAEKLLEQVRSTLEEQAIFVDADWASWDVTSESSTVALNKRTVLKSNGCKSTFLLVANFSGYLVGNGKLKEAEPQLYELFKYFSGTDSFSVWVEPKTNGASKPGGMMSWLFTRVNARWKWFAKISKDLTNSVSAFKSEAKYTPVLRTGVSTARVCVSHMRLVSND